MFDEGRKFLYAVTIGFGACLLWALIVTIVDYSPVVEASYIPPPKYITYASFSEEYFPRLDELARSIGLQQTIPGGWEVIDVIEAAIEYCECGEWEANDD